MKTKLKLLLPLMFLILMGTGMVTFAASAEQEEWNVVDIVNSERQAVGQGTLKVSDELQAAADIRARELAQEFSHYRPDGTSCFTVLEGTLVNQIMYTGGENIAAGYSDASSVMEGWMDSPGHKGNILDADYTHIGVGCYEENGYRYWVQLFAGIDTSFSGMLENQYGWWYVSNGEIDRNFEGLAENIYGWWYIKNGTVDWNYTGMAENRYGWWYVRNGMIDWSYTGMSENRYGWWYMTNGAVDWNYTGMAENQYGWWFIRNGRLDWNYTGMAENQYGWWYMTGGTVDFNYAGMAENEYGWWFMRNGTVDWNYNGTAELNGRIFNVVNGYGGK